MRMKKKYIFHLISSLLNIQNIQVYCLKLIISKLKFRGGEQKSGMKEEKQIYIEYNNPYSNSNYNLQSPTHSYNSYEYIQSAEPQSLGLLIKKSPVKYNYLSLESQQQKERQWNILCLQCFAMFIFIYASTCSKPNTGMDLHFFVGIMMAIPICAKQTGANLNPAVTYSMTFKNVGRKFSYYSLLYIYVKAQIAGAVLSMVVAIMLNGVYRSPLHPEVAINSIWNNQQYADHRSVMFRMMLSQAVGVFILIFLILYATGPYTFIKNDGAKYVFIAIFVYIGRRFAVMSGNQINFALTVSQAFVGFFECNFKGFQYLFIWLIGDMVGVILATSLYNKIVEPTLSYMEMHNTEKARSRLQVERQVQMKEIKNSKLKQNADRERNHDGWKENKKKLEYF